MKVLHLTTHLNTGGITSYIERLIRPLKSQGVETYVITSEGERIPAFNEKGAHVFRLPLKTKNAFHPKLLFLLPELNRKIVDLQIDVIHAHTRVTQVLGTVASRMTGIPMVSTCHGFFKPKLGRKLFPCWGHAVIAISEGVREHLIRDFHLPAEKVKLVSNAVDIFSLRQAFFENQPAVTKKSYGFEAQDPVIGIVARLVDDKGHESLIRSVPLLLPEFPNLRVLIVGEGRHKESLEKLVSEFKLQQHVHFCGNVSDITVPLSAIDIFALPATWREGFGLSLVEAMICRKPVIVTDIPALNLMVENLKTGLVIPPKSPEAIAGAVKQLLLDKPLCASLTQAAAQCAEDRFDIPRMVTELESVYRGASRGKP